MTLSAEDTLGIQRVIALHGHLADSREYERFGEILTDDVVYDMESLGLGTTVGLDALRAIAEQTADRQPKAHLVTNIVVTEGPDGEVSARSKGVALMPGGGAGSVVYEDRFRRTPDGWRIEHRSIRPGTAPVTTRG
jgi:3-phenylpropionate/cinnamic acid dioxygenase small subunit